MALNAYAHAIRSNRPPSRGRRHRIENVEVVDPADLTPPRFGALGVIASMQPLEADPLAMEALERTLGTERAALGFPLREIASQTRLILGSAWPRYPLDPILGLHTVVNPPAVDDTTADESREPVKRLQLKPAIDAYTSIGAWASFDDLRKGSIQPGMLADLVVLSDDVFTLTSDKISSVTVAVTIFDGKIVYRRTPRSETEPVPSLQH
jgi:hypothetical protein